MLGKFRKKANRKLGRVGVENKQKIVAFIDSYIKEHGYSPLQREICKATGFAQSSVSRHIWHLVDDGILTIDCSRKSFMRDLVVKENWQEDFKRYFESEVV